MQGMGIPSRDWQSVEQEAFFFNTYKDYEGNEAAFFIDPESYEILGPLDLSLPKKRPPFSEPASEVGTLPKVSQGMGGKLKYLGSVGCHSFESEKPIPGVFLAFSPNPSKQISNQELLEKTTDPQILAFLTQDPKLGQRAFKKLSETDLTDDEVFDRTAIGLVLTNQVEALGNLLKKFPNSRFCVLAPLIFEGLKGLTALKDCKAHLAHRLEPVQPALRLWVKEEDKKKIKDLLFQIDYENSLGFMLEPHPPMEGSAEPYIGPFERNYYEAWPIFGAKAPEFIALLKEMRSEENPYNPYVRYRNELMDEENWTELSEPKYGFSLQIPKSWEIKKYKEGTQQVIKIAGKNAEVIGHFGIRVFQKPESFNLESWSLEKFYGGGYSSMDYHGSLRDYTGVGYAKSDENWTAWGFFIVHNNFILEFWYKQNHASQDEFTRHHEAAYKQIRDSLKLF